MNRHAGVFQPAEVGAARRRWNTERHQHEGKVVGIRPRHVQARAGNIPVRIHRLHTQVGMIRRFSINSLNILRVLFKIIHKNI